MGLQKLYVQGNCIQLLQGLQGLRLLELHMCHQQLLPGVSLEVEPASLAAQSSCLESWSAAGCSINNVTQLSALSGLVKLDLSGNNVADWERWEVAMGERVP